MRSVFGFLAVTTCILLAAGSAMAVPFGGYTSGLTLDAQPTYSFGATTGALKFDSSATLKAQTGAFTGVTSGAASGMLQFSMTPTATIAATPLTLLSFVDPASASGPPITFSVLSVETVNYTIDPANGDTIELYVLGNTGGGSAGASGTLSSLVVNLFGISGVGFTTSATLSDPPVADPNAPAPSAVPEPATLAILGAGLAGMVVVRRRSASR